MSLRAKRSNDKSNEVLTFRQAVAYLESFIHYEKTPPLRKTCKTFDLEGFRRLLDLLGNPQEKLRAVHVAGTKGKGSTCAMIASILKASGYRVGLYTSPHLISYCERIQICGRNIGPAQFARHVAIIKAAIDRCRPIGSDEFRTTFEILTAAAFLEFVRQKVDFAVIETGLGGTLDATNVVRPLVSVLTPISLDHTQLLGKTVRKIARDKAGIIKKGSEVIVGPQTQTALEEIRRRIRKVCHPEGVKRPKDLVGAHENWFPAPPPTTSSSTRKRVPGLGRFASLRMTLDHDWSIANVHTNLKGTRWDLLSKEEGWCLRNLACPLAGLYQAENASLAVMAALALSRKIGQKIPQRAIRKGLKEVRWSGRFQEVGPGVILDGAHNEQSARRLAESFRKIFPGKKVVLVFGVSQEKNVRGMLRHLGGIAHGIVATQSANPRALDGSVLAQLAKETTGLNAYCVSDPPQAVQKAKKIGRPVLVTGSLFLVGEILSAYRRPV